MATIQYFGWWPTSFSTSYLFYNLSSFIKYKYSFFSLSFSFFYSAHNVCVLLFYISTVSLSLYVNKVLVMGAPGWKRESVNDSTDKPCWIINEVGSTWTEEEKWKRERELLMWWWRRCQVPNQTRSSNLTRFYQLSFVSSISTDESRGLGSLPSGTRRR